jgi:hypothetical protein
MTTFDEADLGEVDRFDEPRWVDTAKMVADDDVRDKAGGAGEAAPRPLILPKSTRTGTLDDDERRGDGMGEVKRCGE